MATFTTTLGIMTCCPECGGTEVTVSGDAKPSSDGSEWDVELLGVVDDETGASLPLKTLESWDVERAKDRIADMAQRAEAT